MRKIDATDVRRNFAEVADSVRHTGERLIVQRNGRPLVAIVPVEDARSLEAAGPSKHPPKMDRAAIERLVARTSARPLLNGRSADEILGYDEDGLPH